MKHLLVILVLIAQMPYTASAQFGVRAQVVRADITAPQHRSMVNQDAGTDQWGYDIGAHYWLRMKNHRIEFFPEVSIAQFRGTAPINGRDLTLDMDRYGISLPVSVYPLDLKGDCDCPTFSKQSQWLKKGLFLQVVPAFYQVHASFSDQMASKTWNSQVGLAAGVGIDIGLSDLITITPLIHYFDQFYHSNDEGPLGGDEVRFGVRLALRPDYL